VVFPDLDGHGTHVNVSGAGLARHAPNPTEALQLLEFLTGREAQERMVEENHEYAVHPGIPPPKALAAFTGVPLDTLPLGLLGKHHAQAVKLLDLAGWR
jgi:iron(III) transport system substrate-binding protein